MSINEFRVVWKRRSTDCEALSLWKGRSWWRYSQPAHKRGKRMVFSPSSSSNIYILHKWTWFFFRGVVLVLYIVGPSWIWLRRSCHARRNISQFRGHKKPTFLNYIKFFDGSEIVICSIGLCCCCCTRVTLRTGRKRSRAWPKWSFTHIFTCVYYAFLEQPLSCVNGFAGHSNIYSLKKNQSGEEMNETEPAAANVPKVIFKYPG